MSLYASLGISDDELSNLNPDQVEKDVELGGVIPEGKYHALLTGVCKKDAKSGSEGTEFEFHILAGPFKGQIIKDAIWKTDKAKGKNRILLFAHRLGLLASKDVNGKKQYVPAEGKADWPDCRLTACIIDVIIEEYEMTDKVTQKPNGKKGKANRLAFEGVLTLDDPRCKDVIRDTSGNYTTVASNHAAAGAPVDDYAKLGI